MSSYTKGEWTSKGLIIQCSSNGSVIATANRHPFAEGAGEANSHLIAAAPDMYEALKALVGYHERTKSAIPCLADALQALLKAKAEKK